MANHILLSRLTYLYNKLNLITSSLHGTFCWMMALDVHGVVGNSSSLDELLSTIAVVTDLLKKLFSLIYILP